MLIQVTNKCHMGCPHCLQNSTPAGGHMNYETFMNTIEFGKGINCLIYNISGGEPTENLELLEMCKAFDKVSQDNYGLLNFVLSSNGMWLKDKEKAGMVREIERLPSCKGIQVYTHKRYYKEYDWVMKHIKQFDRFPKVLVVDTPIRNMQDLGRARTCDMAQEEIKESKFFMSCLNPILFAKQTRHVLFWSACMQRHGHFCKPLVDYKGNVHLSESWLCPSVGNVNTQDAQSIWVNIQKAEPCGNCAGCRKFLASEEPKIIEARKIIYGKN